MALSTVILLVWVVLASLILKGWAVTHLWLPTAVFILGFLFVIFALLEFVGIIKVQVRRPVRTVAPPAAGPGTVVSPAAPTPPPEQPAV